MKLVFLVFVLSCLFAVSLGFDATDYEHNAVLSDGDDFTVYWKVVGDEIYMAFKAKTLGWVGFGIAEPTSGSMPGSDIVYGHVDDNGVAHIVDAYTVAKETPVTDDCQDWGLVSGEEEGEFTILEVVRKLQTDDKQDRDIPAGQVRVIYAFGTSDSISYHTQRKSAALTFHGEAPVSDLSYMLNDPNVKTLDFLNQGFSPPIVETYYGETDLALNFTEDVHIIGIEHILDNETGEFVHHFVLSGYFDSIKDYIWEWAPGIGPLVLPDVAGFRMGPNGTMLLHLQTHYDNPNSKGPYYDNSGVRIYYTTELREYDAGVLQLGDPIVQQKEPIYAGNGFQSYEYSCPSECTSKLPHNLNVFSSFLHMHAVGTEMWGTHWRGDTLLSVTNRIEYWDFLFQQQTPVNFVVQPGDRLNTHCIYKQTPGEEIVFGLGSLDEMCIEYLTYYPKLTATNSYCGLTVYNNTDVTYCFSDVLPLPQPAVNDTNVMVPTFGVDNDNGYTCPNEYPTAAPSVTTDDQDSESSGVVFTVSMLVMFMFMIF